MTILCLLVGHRYYIKKRLTSHSRCLGCKRCGRYFGMNDDVHMVIPWSIELTELHEYSPYRK
jgi:hypothetical protein